MRSQELALRPKYTARGKVLYQVVRTLPSRSGADMYKTLDPHFPLVSFQTVQDVGFSIERILERSTSISVLPARRSQPLEEDRREQQVLKTGETPTMNQFTQEDRNKLAALMREYGHLTLYEHLTPERQARLEELGEELQQQFGIWPWIHPEYGYVWRSEENEVIAPVHHDQDRPRY